MLWQFDRFLEMRPAYIILYRFVMTSYHSFFTKKGDLFTGFVGGHTCTLPAILLFARDVDRRRVPVSVYLL